MSLTVNGILKKTVNVKKEPYQTEKLLFLKAVDSYRYLAATLNPYCKQWEIPMYGWTISVQSFHDEPKGSLGETIAAYKALFGSYENKRFLLKRGGPDTWGPEDEKDPYFWAYSIISHALRVRAKLFHRSRNVAISAPETEPVELVGTSTTARVSFEQVCLERTVSDPICGDYFYLTRSFDGADPNSVLLCNLLVFRHESKLVMGSQNPAITEFLNSTAGIEVLEYIVQSLHAILARLQLGDGKASFVASKFNLNRSHVDIVEWIASAVQDKLNALDAD